jgi:hypothetical protein
VGCRTQASKGRRAQRGLLGSAASTPLHGICLSRAVAQKNAAGFADQIGSHEIHTIATRIFQALKRYLFGKRRRPRF